MAWKDFFGGDEGIAKAKATMKEMRQDGRYSLTAKSNKEAPKPKPTKANLPPRPMTGAGKSAVDVVKNPFFKETDKFSGTGNYASAGGRAKAPAAAAPKPKAKPAMPAAAKPKAKPAMPAAAAPKPKAKPASSGSATKSAFKGNWAGAAPTAMQARGGAKAKAKESSFQRTQRMQRERGVGGR